MSTSDLSQQEADIRKKAASDGITHLSTGVIIVQDSKILLVRRVPNDFLGGVYELPGGGIEDDENFAESVRREVLEETGLDVSIITHVLNGFDYKTDKKPRVRQINFIVTTKPGNTILDPSEHDDYKWVDQDLMSELNVTDAIKSSVYAAFKLL